MAYDPDEHKATNPYDEGDNPDLESDDDVLSNLSPWGIDGEDSEESELNLAAKLDHQSTISNSPPPDTDKLDNLDTPSKDQLSLDDEDDEEVPWEALEEEELDEMADEEVE